MSASRPNLSLGTQGYLPQSAQIHLRQARSSSTSESSSPSSLNPQAAMEAMTPMHDAAIRPSAMDAQLAAAFADVSTMCDAWLATAPNEYEAMSKADASAMEQYRISHDGRTHIEHHALLADLFTAFFELFIPGCAPAAASAAPAASSAPATAAAPAASAAPTASGRVRPYVQAISGRTFRPYQAASDEQHQPHQPHQQRQLQQPRQPRPQHQPH